MLSTKVAPRNILIADIRLVGPRRHLHIGTLELGFSIINNFSILLFFAVKTIVRRVMRGVKELFTILDRRLLLGIVISCAMDFATFLFYDGVVLPFRSIGFPRRYETDVLIHLIVSKFRRSLFHKLSFNDKGLDAGANLLLILYLHRATNIVVLDSIIDILQLGYVISPANRHYICSSIELVDYARLLREIRVIQRGALGIVPLPIVVRYNTPISGVHAILL